MGVIIPDSSFIDAAVVEYVAPLPLGLPFVECSLVVGAVFEKELAFSMELVVLPLPQIKPARRLHLFKLVPSEALVGVKVAAELEYR